MLTDILVILGFWAMILTPCMVAMHATHEPSEQ